MKGLRGKKLEIRSKMLEQSKGGTFMYKIKSLFMAFLIVSAFLAGCGTNAFQSMDDKNSDEATALETTKRLDSRNYDAILADPDSANATDYAAAAMGAAGLDPVDLISTLTDIADSINKNDLSSITALNLNPDAFDELQAAKTKLEAELNCPSGPKCKDPDLNFQLVMTSLTSTITAIAQVGGNAAITVTDGITPAEAVSIASLITTSPQVDTNGDGTTDTNLVTLIANGVVNVGESLPNADLGTNSELNNVLTDTTTGPRSLNYDGTGNVSDQDVTKYLNCVIGNATTGC